MLSFESIAPYQAYKHGEKAFNFKAWNIISLLGKAARKNRSKIFPQLSLRIASRPPRSAVFNTRRRLP